MWPKVWKESEKKKQMKICRQELWKRDYNHIQGLKFKKKITIKMSDGEPNWRNKNYKKEPNEILKL